MFRKFLLASILCSYSFSLQATLPGSPPQQTPLLKSPAPQTKPSQQTTPSQPQPSGKIQPAPYRSKPLVKKELPPMTKPFGMPGVIGLQNGRWVGTDYLGFLSNDIGISVEIIKSENIEQISSPDAIEGLLAGIFEKENINPRSDVVEGPPLPFLQVLILVYQLDKDLYVVFGNGRLFEQIQVIRKNFIPSGFWQGITWENQDVAFSNRQQLDSQIRMVAEKIATNFATRYRQYNLN